jgi:hypothetical protein
MTRRNFISMMTTAAVSAVLAKPKYFFLNGIWQSKNDVVVASPNDYVSLRKYGRLFGNQIVIPSNDTYSHHRPFNFHKIGDNQYRVSMEDFDLLEKCGMLIFNKEIQ